MGTVRNIVLINAIFDRAVPRSFIVSAKASRQCLSSAPLPRGPSGLMVRASDWYSEGLGFESLLDPFLFSMGLFLTLAKTVILISTS